MPARGDRGKGAALAGAVALMLVVVAPVGARPALAAGAPGVTVVARVDDRPLRESTETRPLRLSPKKDATLSVEVTNAGPDPIQVKIVRLEGRVVGLSFFAYDTAVGLTVPPGGRGSRRFLLDLGGLDGQATGLVPGSVLLLDPDRHVLAEDTGVVDVRGSLRSVYGLFGIGVALLTVISFGGALVGLIRHRLPPNRWRRALRFLTPGLGLGLLLNFTLSATRVFVPSTGRWLTIVVVSAAVFFGLGYLTPTPVTEEEEEEEEELLALPGPPAQPELAPLPVMPELAAEPARAALGAEPQPAALPAAPVPVGAPTFPAGAVTAAPRSPEPLGTPNPAADTRPAPPTVDLTGGEP